ncbi:MAG: nitrogenase [Acaryochloridaceae cyanobacterium SU_2_1]|nr:nitrogenase [Acaryochloridaceae cyanobacterium SU_2_1]NJM95289.1 nitrogenase [Acaryochloridaceae cyanobacterium CSU_5_19]
MQTASFINQSISPPRQSRQNPVQFIVRRAFVKINVENPQVAHRICKLIPAQCPFARDIVVFGHRILHIPPLCKLNPAYDEFVALRFQALTYLADCCGEDISSYC